MIEMIDMFEVNRIVLIYRHEYPEIKIYVTYVPSDVIGVVEWNFQTRCEHADRCYTECYETYHGRCIAYDTQYVIDQLNDSFSYFLSTDGVKTILNHTRKFFKERY